MLTVNDMRLHSYRVARDYGFAPNPFHGFCTLATCKPSIRKTARVGDWIVGTGSKVRSRENHIVFAMHVAEKLTFDEYWSDSRFIDKRPNRSASLKYAYGDNIYHRDADKKRWIQEDSHHSYDDGRPNENNIRRDTSTDQVLVSTCFYYWGGSGPPIPCRFLGSEEYDIRVPRRGHTNSFPKPFIDEFINWIKSNYESSRCFGKPLDWG